MAPGFAASHASSKESAEAALEVAAVDPAAFHEFAQWLFAHQGQLTEQAITAEAHRRVGAAAFDEAIDSPRLRARVIRDVELARQLDVTSVPRLALPTGLVQGTFTARNLAELLGGAWHGTQPTAD